MQLCNGVYSIIESALGTHNLKTVSRIDSFNLKLKTIYNLLEDLHMLFFGEGRKRDERTNGRTHRGKKGDTHYTYIHSNGKLFSKVGY